MTKQRSISHQIIETQITDFITKKPPRQRRVRALNFFQIIFIFSFTLIATLLYQFFWQPSFELQTLFAGLLGVGLTALWTVRDFFFK